jgi:hypothetical protein
MVTRARRLWSIHFLAVEFAIGVLLVATTVVTDTWIWPGWLDAVLSGDLGALWGTVAAISGALLGFVLAAASILAVVPDGPRVARLRASSQYPQLWRTYLSATWWFTFLTLAAIVQLVVQEPHSPPQRPWIFVTLLFSLVATFRLLRCIWILDKVLTLQGRDREPSHSATSLH